MADPHMVLGLALWAVFLYPLWSPRCRRIRRNAKITKARAEAYVARDPRAVAGAAKYRDLIDQADPNWSEQAPIDPTEYEASEDERDDLE